MPAERSPRPRPLSRGRERGDGQGSVPRWITRISYYYLNGTLRKLVSETFLWAVVVSFLLPLLFGVIVGRLTLVKRLDKVLDLVGLGYVDRMPSAWDFIVREPRGSYVRIHLKDGRGIVGGVFGEHSVASLDPHRADVYLQEAWRLDEEGNFVDAVLDSRGVWVAHDVMAYVDFLDRGEESDGEESGETSADQEDQQPWRDSGHRQAGSSTEDEPESPASSSDAAYRQEAQLVRERPEPWMRLWPVLMVILGAAGGFVFGKRRSSS